MSAPAVVNIQNLVFAWPGQSSPCVALPSFALQAGEQVFLHGESGSGKSTLLALVAGVLQPRQGAVSLLGTPYASVSASRRDRLRVDHIGFIFQQFNLLPYLSVLDNVLLPCRFSKRRHARVASADLAAGRTPPEEAARLLSRLDLDSALWSRPAALLSVGQQQRVAAARALIGQPELLIADEPTSALDAARQEAFLELLKAECMASGAALLFVSHDARLAQRFDRVVSMQTLQAGSQ